MVYNFDIYFRISMLSFKEYIKKLCKYINEEIFSIVVVRGFGLCN